MADINLIQNNSAQNNVIVITNGSSNKLSNKNQEYREPPDGGARAWLVVTGAFLCNSILFGVINTYGVIYLTLQEKLMSHGDSEASSKAALVGSLTIGTTFLLSPVAGILTDKIGLRNTTFIGGILAAGGLFLSSFCIDSIEALYLTYGIMFGLGAALAYTPSLAILGHYFKKYLGLASGFVTSGSSVFTAILPSGLDYLLKTYGLDITFFVLATMALIILLCALIYKPVLPPPPKPIRNPEQSNLNAFMVSLVNLDNWKKKKYIIWALSIPLALIGYFVPYVHMAKLVKITFPHNNENTPIVCIGITSGIGRILFGYIADFKIVNRIYLQQISFVLLGLLTIAIPLTPSYVLLLIITLGMGLVDGCFISLLGPIAYDICGPRGAAQAIGFLLGLCSIPLTVGPPIAGMIYDQTHSYTISFILAGIPPLAGALMMCMIHFVSDDKCETDEPVNEQLQSVLGKPAWIEDNIVDSKVVQGNNHLLNTGRKASLASSESLNDTTGKI